MRSLRIVSSCFVNPQRIRNCSRGSISVHIIPPSTDFFSISYSKRHGWLVPGLALDVTISFKPSDWKYYSDCIRIHCQASMRKHSDCFDWMSLMNGLGGLSTLSEDGNLVRVITDWCILITTVFDETVI